MLHVPCIELKLYSTAQYSTVHIIILIGAGYSLNVMKTAKQFPKTSQEYTPLQVIRQEK